MRKEFQPGAAIPRKSSHNARRGGGAVTPHANGLKTHKHTGLNLGLTGCGGYIYIRI